MYIFTDKLPGMLVGRERIYFSSSKFHHSINEINLWRFEIKGSIVDYKPKRIIDIIFSLRKCNIQSYWNHIIVSLDRD